MNLKLAFRTLFKTPFVTIVAILSLALGIGANAAIFSLFDQMLLRPLPVQRAGAAGQPVGAGAEAGLATRAARPATATRCSATRCSATSSGADGVHRHRGARRRSAPTSRYRGADD